MEKLKDYAPCIIYFCNKIASGSYLTEGMHKLRSELDILKKYRHSYKEKEGHEDITALLQDIHGLEHGAWTVYAVHYIKQRGKEIVANLYVGNDGQIRYRKKERNKRNNIRADLEDYRAEVRQEKTLDVYLTEISQKWSQKIITDAGRVINSKHLQGISPAEAEITACRVEEYNGLVAALSSIKNVLSDEIIPRIGCFIIGKSHNLSSVAYYAKNEGRDSLLTWSQKHFRPWKLANCIEDEIYKSRNLIDNLESFDDGQMPLKISLEIAWVLAEHIEGLHELLKVQTANSKFDDLEFGKQIYLSGQLLELFIYYTLAQIDSSLAREITKKDIIV